jgi:hypothetical protein
MSSALDLAFIWFMNTAFERLLALGLISWVIGLVLGERARRMIADLWLAAFRLTLQAVGLLGRAMMRTFQPNRSLRGRPKAGEDIVRH